jgi:hypothetical protein
MKCGPACSTNGAWEERLRTRHGKCGIAAVSVGKGGHSHNLGAKRISMALRSVEADLAVGVVTAVEAAMAVEVAMAAAGMRSVAIDLWLTDGPLGVSIPEAFAYEVEF